MVQSAAITTNMFFVRGERHGSYSGSLSVINNQVTFTPDIDYFRGELITVTLTTNILSVGGAALTSGYAFQFFVATEGCSDFTFADSGQLLGSLLSLAVHIGDLNGDGDLDAVFSNDGQANRVYVNDGQGGFSDSGQLLGNAVSRDTGLADVDGDGDIDLLFANNGFNRVYTNNGAGGYTDSGQSLGLGTGVRQNSW